MLETRKFFSQKKDFFLSIVYALLIFDILFQFYVQATDVNKKDSWEITEWLINYRGGFVRRGLAGEIILWLYDYFKLSPYSIIICVCAGSYIVVVVYFVYSFYKKGYSLFLLPFVFFLGNPIINTVWIRKDLLLILFLIAIIHFGLKRKKFSIVIVNLVFIIAVLMHEAIGFFCLPILFLILSNKRENFTPAIAITSIGKSILKLSPSIITFILALYCKGSMNISTMIWNSWKQVPFPYPDTDNSTTPPAALDGLSWTLSKGLSMLKGTFQEFYSNFLYAPLAWAIVIIVIYYIFINASKTRLQIFQKKAYNDFNKQNISNILVFQFLTVIPLFILGCDFGRWIFFWIASSFAIYLLVPEEKLSILFPSLLTRLSLKFNNILDSIFPQSEGFIYVLAFLVSFPPITSGPTWKIGIEGFYNGSALVIALKLISVLIKKCISLF